MNLYHFICKYVLQSGEGSSTYMYRHVEIVSLERICHLPKTL